MLKNDFTRAVWINFRLSITRFWAWLADQIAWMTQRKTQRKIQRKEPEKKDISSNGYIVHPNGMLETMCGDTLGIAPDIVCFEPYDEGEQDNV